MKKLFIALLSILLLTGCQTGSLQPGDSDKPDSPAEPVRSFSFGQKVSFNDDYFYVIDEGDDYLTLLYKESFVPVSENNRTYEFFYDIFNYEENKFDYNQSTLKHYLEEELINRFDENTLVTVDGFKIRLLQVEDIVDKIPFEKTVTDDDLISYRQKDNENYNWLISPYDDYWTMSKALDDVGGAIYGESQDDEFYHYSWFLMSNYGQITLTTVAKTDCLNINYVVNANKQYVTKTR